DDYPIKKYRSRIQGSGSSKSPTPGQNPGQAPTPGPSPGSSQRLTPALLGLVLGDDEERDGALIEKVKKDSFAAKKGFQKGDLVVQFGEEEVMDSYDLEEKLLFADLKKKLVFHILRKVKDKRGKWIEKKVVIQFFWKKES
ncbi:MAG: PDZ domain-containing protein, partial [Planctomycetota bacterium]